MPSPHPYQLTPLNIRTIQHLALRINFPEKILIRIANNLPRFYYPERMEPKSSGGERPIDEPKPELKRTQKKINRLLQEVRLPPNFYGAVKGKCHIDNAAQHTNKAYVACFDIEDFFLSIRYNKVKSLFIYLGCSPQVAILLTKLTTFKRRVPQGAPTSSTLANLILARYERRFSNLARLHGLTVTFQQDDVSFSGQMDISRIKNLVKKIFAQIGFRIQEKKLKIKARHQRQLVTGLLVNRKVNISRTYIRGLRAALYNLSRGTLPKSNLKSVEGKVRYVQRVNPKVGNRLFEKFQKVESQFSKN